MQRIKKPFIWLTLLSLVLTLLPAGLAPVAKAADTAILPTYFIPSDPALRNTFRLVTEFPVPTGREQINRNNVYKSSKGTFEFGGTFAKVSPNNMTVKVERLMAVPVQVGTTEHTKWEPDTTNVFYSSVSVDSTDTSGMKFKVNDLKLFPGFNRITMSGTQNGLTQSESFYVLYDEVPYLQELKMYEGTSIPKYLNEGTPVVTKVAALSLEGTAMNATKIELSLNGKKADTLPFDDLSGKFYASGQTLDPGINILDFVITNGADTIKMQRTIYLYSDTDRITGLDLFAGNDDSKAVNVLNNVPTITEAFDTDAKLIAQVLIPYDSTEGSFGPTASGGAGVGKVSYQFKGDTAYQNATFEIVKMKAVGPDGSYDNSEGQEVLIPDVNGNPEYRLVTLAIDVPDPSTSTQFTLKIEYGSGTPPMFTTTKDVSYKYLPGESVIRGLSLLPTFNDNVAAGKDDQGNAVNYNMNDFSKTPLNGASVNSSTFYILVDSSAAPADTLKADYLPLGSKTLSINKVALPASFTIQANQEVYKITNFSTGQQRVRFWYISGEDVDATISYITMSKISFTNFIYGQTYPVNSKNPDTLKLSVKGQYIGFENFDASKPDSGAKYTVNGVAITEDTDNKITFTGNDFTLNLSIGADGPLYYGENRITLYGTSRDGNGNARYITGELLLYIVDENGATISSFMPISASSTASLPPDTLLTDILDGTASAENQTTFNNIIADLFRPSTDYIYSPADQNYTTNKKEANLVFRGSGASKANVYFGSQLLFSININPSDVTVDNGNFDYDFGDGKKVGSYSFVGTEKDFMVRVYDLDINVPGSYIFNLELINNTGSRTSKRLEIVRTVESYRLISPQPTVGDQYVMNKNFVHFDIEAEGATRVLIDKFEATPRQESGKEDRFVYDYVGLKPDKATKIKISIVRADTTFTDTIEVFYTSAVDVDSQFMAEKVSNKYTVLNKNIQLTFPKGTILQSANPGSNAIQYYPDTKLLFGIADPTYGTVGKRDDYGNYIEGQRPNEEGNPKISIPVEFSTKFAEAVRKNNFTPISQLYWISGGVGESMDGSKKATNGLAPHSLEGTFTMFSTDRKVVPSQRGELTLTFDKNVVDEAGTTITVFRFTDGGIWENIGGEVNTKNHTITVPFDDFGYYTVMKLRKGFTDITNHPWARNILNALYAKGIMNKLYGDTFGTDDRISRGEFATLLVKGLNIPLNYPRGNDAYSKSSFQDVGPSARTETWSYEYIETAARAGIVTGTTEGAFSPYMPITREQAAVMIARALKLKLAVNDEKLNSTLAKAFVDSGSMDVYARPAIQAVNGAKIMTGTPNTLPGQKKPVYSFNPKGFMTRAEAGKITVELLKKSTAIFPKNLS